jgi:membrane-bound metal-dependent hydrolase YbcI (DUF457 family)
MLATSHRLMAACGAVLLGASPLQAVAAALGATLPDRIEVVGLPHRGLSHWPWPWALAVWATSVQPSPWGVLVAWWLAGALFHIGADLFTVGGVPLFLPHRRVRCGMVHTGGVGEYVMVVLLMVAACLYVLDIPLIQGARSWPRGEVLP